MIFFYLPVFYIFLPSSRLYTEYIKVFVSYLLPRLSVVVLFITDSYRFL